MTNTASSTTTDAITSNMPTELDLAFIIDATSSMGSYIQSAKDVCIFIEKKYLSFKINIFCRICDKLFKILLEVNDVY